MTGTLIDTDVLVIGAGAGGLLAALSAKRHGPPGTRVTIVDTWLVGRTGHTAFSNAWTVVVEPQDDLDAIAREIIAGNDWMADQPLVHEVLATSHDRLKDLEALELAFPKDAAGRYVRRPTRGLDATRVTGPVGGGMELCWRLRRALEAAGVQILDRIFVTGLMRGRRAAAPGDAVTGAVGVHSRSGDFHVLKARATIVCTNAITFRSGFVRDITGTGTLLAYKAGARLRNMEFSYTRPSTPRFYFEGITFAIQEGARFLNSKGERFMLKHEPTWGDEADVPRIARAMALERHEGNDPLYLDMSSVPVEVRGDFIKSKVKWMEYFYRKLGNETGTDLFDKAPYYPQNQMTKGGVRTDGHCRSDVPGLLVAGLAQAGAANHFAGFHIGMCIGTGWIAGRSAIEDLDRLAVPVLDAAEVNALRAESYAPLDAASEAESDRLLRNLQSLMFAYDVSVWKHADRLAPAIARLAAIRDEFAALAAPHTHELVRLKETEAMLLAADVILRASQVRTESRLSHFREDYELRDDANWLCWVDVRDDAGTPRFESTPIPTPISAPGGTDARVRRVVKGAA
ncbi:MAG: FAD-binding protein [Betaproteobacteria bacterium]|nr:FAD-binding protein [Betaproteobacteria bacterium]